MGGEAQASCLAEAGKGPDRRMPSPANQGGALHPPATRTAMKATEPRGTLLLFFLRRLLLFFPRAAEPSERTEELWMLALSKSDSSRSSSSLCGGGGGPCEPAACAGGSSRGSHWLGQRMRWRRAGCRRRLQRYSVLCGSSLLPPARNPKGPTHPSSPMSNHPPQPCSPPCHTPTHPSRESPKGTSSKDPSQISP